MADYPTSLRDGRYAVVGLLGEGTQAQTLDAVDKKHGRAVAIKRFVVRGARSWKDVELAEREATVLSHLTHPNLPAYYEHFEENGELFLVIEKIEGESLAALRKRGATLSRAEVLRFLRELAGVLDYLHGRAPPIFHRDIKPGNVIRRPDGSFALVDFGSVRARLQIEGGSTVVGTFGYMAPEQFQGRALPQTDVYAVGATAICLLTGSDPEDLPHQGLKIDAERILGDDRELGGLLGKMLEPDPDKRPARLSPLLARLSSGTADSQPAPPPRSSANEAERSLAGPAEGLPFPIWLVFVLGLIVARIAVFATLGVFVPALLTLLGYFFGAGLHRGARAVRAAAVNADRTLERAVRVVRGMEVEPLGQHGRRRVRVETGGRARARRKRVVETTAEEMDAEQDFSRGRRRARR